MRRSFVLIHGSWHGGWCWRRVADLLRKAGHEVWTPTLAGCAELYRATSGAIDLETHVSQIRDILFFEDIHDGIIVGHSYAGLILQALAASPMERVSRLVFLDGYLVPIGKSAWDVWPDEQRRSAEAAVERGYQFRDPIAPQKLGIDDPVAAEWLKQRMRPHPLKTYRSSMQPVHPANAELANDYIHFANGPTASLFSALAASAKSLGWRTYSFELPHDAMLTAPLEVAELLLSVVANNEAGPNQSLQGVRA